MIERHFETHADGKFEETAGVSLLFGLEHAKAMSWDDLLKHPRTLIISEAGSGKTYECQQQAQRLYQQGNPAFFIELAPMAEDGLCTQLLPEAQSRLETWLSNPVETATFFLDSIDELTLSRKSFASALKRFRRDINDQLKAARIIITTRPTPSDEGLIRELLPVAETAHNCFSEISFEDIATGKCQSPQMHNKLDEKDGDHLKIVGLLPLSEEQIIELARAKGVKKPEQLLAELKRQDGLEFAYRPLDLIDLCKDWNIHHCIRSHKEQIETNIHSKLLPNPDREEPAELSSTQASEGACRLALATHMTRQLTIRHNNASEDLNDSTALDPQTILQNWAPNEQKALLQRSLFSFASCGRVRFHHRSVSEYLAAKHLQNLRSQGMPWRALKRLLFVETNGKIIVRPSKRAITAWVAQDDQHIFELIVKHDPVILLNEGDPQSLRSEQRRQILCAYISRYRSGGWRGLDTPRVQIRRFCNAPAAADIAKDVLRLWHQGIENPEVRETLLNMIEFGRWHECMAVAQQAANDIDLSESERLFAIEALIALDADDLTTIAEKVATQHPDWPNRIARGALTRLFPHHVSIQQLCQALSWIKPRKNTIGDIDRHFAYRLKDAKLTSTELDELRDRLVKLLMADLRQEKNTLELAAGNYKHLHQLLAATCQEGLKYNYNQAWLEASALALHICDRHTHHGPSQDLQETLADANSLTRQTLFWSSDSLAFKNDRTNREPLQRLFSNVLSINRYSPLTLNESQDLAWICQDLSDPNRDLHSRQMLLEAAARLPWEHTGPNLLPASLHSCIDDQPELLAAARLFFATPTFSDEHKAWQEKHAKQEKLESSQEQNFRDEWRTFREEIITHPDAMFSTDKCENTATNLYNALYSWSSDAGAPTWNRALIEHYFNKDIANRLRNTLMSIWRKDTTNSDPQPGYGQLGLTAIYAEAEDSEWSNHLNEAESFVACHYALVEYSGLFPPWLNALNKAHPDAVEVVIGGQLTNYLAGPYNEQSPTHSMTLQRHLHAGSSVAKRFLPQLLNWLNQPTKPELSERTRYITDIILKHGDAKQLAQLGKLATQELSDSPSETSTSIWLPVLFKDDADKGIAFLAQLFSGIEPSVNSTAVGWIAQLFGEHRNTIPLSELKLSPRQLLALAKLAYTHVRLEDDVPWGNGARYTGRHDAERGRNSILSMLLKANGEAGLSAKLELAEASCCSDIKDRLVALAEQHRAEEIDTDQLDDNQAAALNQRCEALPTTHEAMFALMNDRLLDLQDGLEADDSPGTPLAGLTQETDMRRAIARELRVISNDLYEVSQEAPTAHEKRTDIRLSSNNSNHEAVIELKLAEKENHSAHYLCKTIEDQLVKKYMAAASRKSGCLLITLAKNRHWQHPETGKRIGLEELKTLLKNEAKRVENHVGGGIQLSIFILDLRSFSKNENAD